MKHFANPEEAYYYIEEKELETEFLTNMMKAKEQFTIAEIADGDFKLKGDKVTFVSAGFKIKVDIIDEEIVTAVHNQLYVSSFLSRNGDSYNVHFLVSKYPVSMKERFEDKIAREVVKYMMLSTISALKLDTDRKIKEYTA